MKSKAIIFHPAIAPYRIDFFNSIAATYNATFYFSHKDALEQSFDQNALINRLNFIPNYLKKGRLKVKNLHFEVLPILFKKKPDIIICSEYNSLGLLVLLYKFLSNRKVKIFTICDDSKMDAVTTKGIRKYTRYIMIHFINGIISANKEVIDWYNENYKNINQKLLYFPIIQEDISFRTQLQEVIYISKELFDIYNLRNKKVISFVGRLVKIKNVELLIESFNEICYLFSDVILIIIGDGEEWYNLNQKVQNYHLTNKVYFVGKKQGADLLAWYNIIQILVLPSTKEPFGAVVNEALLSGCLVNNSSIAGSTSIISNGINGYIFDPYKQSELINTLTITLSQISPLSKIVLRENKMIHSYDIYWKDFTNQMNTIIYNENK